VPVQIAHVKASGRENWGKMERALRMISDARARGVNVTGDVYPYPAGSTKAAQFIQLCCQSGTPLIYLQNTTGYLVGREAEAGGAIKHGSKMIQAVANAREASLRGDERLDEDNLFVKTATVDMGPPLKRFMPAAMGRATPVKKHTSHVTIVVATKE